MKPKEYSFCSFCGTPADPKSAFPRRCKQCHSTTFRNPQPVVAVVVPVGNGVLAIRRGFDGYGGGKIALPGGFIEVGETWQQAAVREVREETAVEISIEGLMVLGAHSVQQGRRLVVTCLAQAASEVFPPFKPNREISERMVLYAPQTLAFESHTEILAAYFAKTFHTESSLSR